MPEIKEEEEKKTRALKRCCSSGSKNRRKKIKEEKKNTPSLVLKRFRKRCRYELNSNYFFPARVNYINIDWFDDNDFNLKFPKETYLKKTKPLEIEIGKPLPKDVCSSLPDYLVRNNGERVELSEAIRGKYLIICCFFVPLLSNDLEADRCRALINTYNELKKKKDVSVEMVMVAKMRCSFIAEDEEEPTFNLFFSEFPCLAVPFEEETSRNMICKLLGLSTRNDVDSACLILDPKQKILQEGFTCIENYGAASFPFTDDHLISLHSEVEQLRMRLDPAFRYCSAVDPDNPLLSKPLTLEELFCCKSSTPLGQCRGGNQTISVSQLSKRNCVALYLCTDGSFMSSLESIRAECVESGFQFEIVIIYQPSCSENSRYFKAVEQALIENDISSWWVLPFVDQVSRRLHKICYPSSADNVIIWAYGGSDGEMAGVDFMRIFDSPTYYPFTKNSWVKAKISTLMSLTLESFLGGNGPVIYNGNELKVPDLKNRNILLYLDNTSSALFYEKLCKQYEQIKEDYPDSEVVCLLNDPKKVSVNSLPHLSGPVTIPKGVTNATLVAFGADNKIKSLHAYHRLGSEFSLFEDTLLEEVHEELTELLL